MPRPPGPTPPPSSKTVAPPPPRRTPNPGNGADASPSAGAGRSAAPRPAPQRPPTEPRPGSRRNARRRPNHGLRRSIALAVLLTVVVLVGYGAYVAYDKIRGDSSPSAQDSTGYAASVETATAHGDWAIGMGLNFHNLKDSYVLRNQFNAEINTVREERAHLESLLPNVLGARADTVRASIESMNDLESALGQWRDAIFLLRFGNLGRAQTGVR